MNRVVKVDSPSAEVFMVDNTTAVVRLDGQPDLTLTWDQFCVIGVAYDALTRATAGSRREELEQGVQPGEPPRLPGGEPDRAVYDK